MLKGKYVNSITKYFWFPYEEITSYFLILESSIKYRAWPGLPEQLFVSQRFRSLAHPRPILFTDDFDAGVTASPEKCELIIEQDKGRGREMCVVKPKHNTDTHFPS